MAQNAPAFVSSLGAAADLLSAIKENFSGNNPNSAGSFLKTRHAPGGMGEPRR